MTPPRTQFELISPRPPRAARYARWGTVAAFIALAGIVAATGLTVQQRTDTASLFAERYNVGEQFVVVTSTIAPVAASLSARGVLGVPVEMDGAFPEARTALTRDHWAYTVVLRESALDSVTSGNFSVELQVDGAPVGMVVFAQLARQPSVAEGVTARFGLGAALNPSALYYVVVRPILQVGPTVDLTIRSSPSGDFTWVGVGGAIDGVVNPELSIVAGSVLRLTARNADGALHDVGFRDASGALLDPPGWSPDISVIGDQTTIAWRPESAGTYTYVCKYHATTMRGSVVVTA